MATGTHGMNGPGDSSDLVCGRRGKWLIVLALWLVAAGGRRHRWRQKLTDAQDNDAASWLPGSAESTQVLALSEDVQAGADPRGRRLRPRGRAHRGRTERRIAEDAARIKELDRRTACAAPRPAGPVYDRPAGPRAAQIYRAHHHGREGLGASSRPPSTPSATSVGEGGGGLAVHITGPGRHLGRLLQGLRGHRLARCCSRAIGVVIVMLLITYRSLTLLLRPADSAWSPRCSPPRR